MRYTGAMSMPPYTLIRSRRRTTALIVTPEARLVVRAPLRASDAVIEKFVRAHEAWIARAMERARRLPAPPARHFAHGEYVPYLGVSYPLTVAAHAARPLAFSPATGFVMRARDCAKARALFEAWYRAAAREYIGARAAALSQKYGISYRAVKITAARRRWGSCSSAGTLNFSWRCVMAPSRVVDYIVAHELAHRSHMNHGPRFWRLVEAMHPTYRADRSVLVRHGAFFTL